MITMKRRNKVLFAIVIILVIFAGIATFTYQEKEEHTHPALDENTTVIGENSNGTVYKITCGNNSSSDTAIVILGVHSLESGIHNATYEKIIKFSQENELNKKFIVYFINLNFEDSGMNTSDYDTNRHMGELLTNEYVLPDIEKYDPYVVVDVHEMEDYWEHQRYVGVLDNESDLTMEYAHRIGNNLSYPVLTVNAGTSPEWVTIPISEKGHITILFETAQADSQSEKAVTAEDLVRTIDRLPIY
jgi:hypothetical protein